MRMMRMMVLTFILVIFPISIGAGKDLMLRECHNAPFPTICMQCLESDPTSVRADPIGIAGIVINCLASHLHFLSNNITKLLSEKLEKGDAIKTALETCKKEVSYAITILPDAKSGLKTGDYDKAGQSVHTALGFPLGCRYNLQIAKFQSYQLFTLINIYAQLSDAAMRIIDRF